MQLTQALCDLRSRNLDTEPEPDDFDRESCLPIGIIAQCCKILCDNQSCKHVVTTSIHQSISPLHAYSPSVAFNFTFKHPKTQWATRVTRSFEMFWMIVTVDYPRLLKGQLKLEGVEITQDFPFRSFVSLQPLLSLMQDLHLTSAASCHCRRHCCHADNDANMTIVDCKIAIIGISLDIIIIYHNHDTDQHVDPHSDQDTNQHLHCCYYHGDHSTAYHSDAGSSWQYIIQVRDFVIHFEPNPSQKISQGLHRAFPILSQGFPYSVSNMTLWVCLHSPLHVLAHASAAWFFVLLLLPVKRPQRFKVRVCHWDIKVSSSTVIPWSVKWKFSQARLIA